MPCARLRPGREQRGGACGGARRLVAKEKSRGTFNFSVPPLSPFRPDSVVFAFRAAGRSTPAAARLPRASAAPAAALARVRPPPFSVSSLLQPAAGLGHTRGGMSYPPAAWRSALRPSGAEWRPTVDRRRGASCAGGGGPATGGEEAEESEREDRGGGDVGDRLISVFLRQNLRLFSLAVSAPAASDAHAWSSKESGARRTACGPLRADSRRCNRPVDVGAPHIRNGSDFFDLSPHLLSWRP